MLKRTSILTIVICLVANLSTSAQIIPKTLTLKSHPIDEAKSFLLTEFYVNRQFERYTLPNRSDWETGAVVGWELGYMRNLNARWALGASAFFNGADDRAQIGLKPRARYWLGKSTSVDFSAGPILKTFNDDYTSSSGFASHIAINADTWLAFTLAVEYSKVRTTWHHIGKGTPISISGDRTSISAGARVGAMPGIIVGTVAPLVVMTFAYLFIREIDLE